MGKSTNGAVIPEKHMTTKLPQSSNSLLESDRETLVRTIQTKAHDGGCTTHTPTGQRLRVSPGTDEHDAGANVCLEGARPSVVSGFHSLGDFAH